MNQCLQYTVTPRDIVNLAFDGISRSRTSWIVRSIAAVALVAMGIYDCATRGFGWGLTFYFVGAWLIFNPVPIAPLILLTVVWRPTHRIWLTDDGVRTEWKERQHEISWSSLSKSGTAREQRNDFTLEYGGGGMVVIPKRAFASQDDLAEFRAFVAAKMGTQCQFAQQTRDG